MLLRPPSKKICETMPPTLVMAASKSALVTEDYYGCAKRSEAESLIARLLSR